MTKHQAYVTIKSFNGKKPQNDLAAFDAREVIQYLYVKTKKKEQSAESTGHEGKQDSSRSEKVDITKPQPSQPQGHLQTPSQTTAAYKEQVVSASEYNKRGFEYYKNGQYNQAIEQFTIALSMENNSSYYINRGFSFYELNQYDKAISDFKQAINLAPNVANAYAGCGNVYFARKSYSEAWEYFSKAIAIEPNKAIPYLSRGYTSIKMGNKSMAASDFKKACDLGNEDGCKQLKVFGQVSQSGTKRIMIKGQWVDVPIFTTVGEGRTYYDAHPEERAMDEATQTNKPIRDMQEKLIEDMRKRQQGYGLGFEQYHRHPASPALPPSPGAIDVWTGQFYPGVPGGIINPNTGQFMPDVGGGYIDPSTGTFFPKQ